MIKVNIHSIVDVITNSSTVIFTYQNSTKQAEELIDEVLKLSGSTEKAKDLFYFNTMCEEHHYLKDMEGTLESWGMPLVNYEAELSERRKQRATQDSWVTEFILKAKNGLLTGDRVEALLDDIKKAESCGDYDYYAPDKSLVITPKSDEITKQYSELIGKISGLLNSIRCEAIYEG